jgi:hypothetical protein
VLAVVALQLLGCGEVSEVPLHTCGNWVVEDDEDCDGTASCNSECYVECSTEQPCPTGLGCDLGEGVCRATTGQLRNERIAFETTFAAPHVVDFDADGRDELLVSDGFSPTRRYSADDRGTFSSDSVLPAATSVVTADVTGDGLPELLLGGDSLLAYRSTTNGGLLPLLAAFKEVPPSTRLLAMDLDCNGSKDIIVQQDNELSVGLLGALYPVGTLKSSSTEQLSAVGNVTAAGLCQVLAVAEPTSAITQLYAFRQLPDEQPVFEYLGEVEVKNGSGIGNLLFADVNRDGKDDLVLQEPPFPGVVESFVSYVAYGVGDGSFHSTAATLPASHGDGIARELPNGPLDHIFAVGELDAVDGLDFFTTWGLADGELSEENGGPYGSAVAVELTGDARIDVAVSSDSTLIRDRSLVVLRGSATGVDSPLPISTRGFATLADSADFDGDGRADLLLTESEKSGAPASSAAVLFSPLNVDTRTPAPLGDFVRVQQVIAGTVYDAYSDDTFADVGLLYEARPGTLQVGFLQGSADRLLRATIPVSGELEALGSEAICAISKLPVFGRFRGPKVVDAVVIEAFVECPMAGAAQNAATKSTRAIELFSADTSGVASQSSFDLDREVDLNLGAVALDIDGDGIDELFVAESTGLDEAELIELHLRDESAWEATSSTSIFDPGRLSMRDVNGDGELDLVSANGTLVVTAADSRGAGHVLTLPFQSSKCAWIQLDRDPERELVCAKSYDERGLRAYDVELASGTLHERDGIDAPARVGSMAVGDLNGDGVEDLVITSDEEETLSAALAILFGEPVR